MTPQECKTLQVVDALNSLRVPHLLAGSFASNFYGIPRSTKDADFVLHHAGGVGAEFALKLGGGFELDPQLTFETVTGTYRQFLYHKDTSFKIELFQLSNDEHDHARFARRQEHVLFGHKVWLLSAEDVIVTKLRWSRGKDEDDIRNVMFVQHDKLDWPYIESWCMRHGTITLLRKIRNVVQDI